MKTKHARHIRAGIYLARMEPYDSTLIILTRRLPRLTHRAFRRECVNVLNRLTHWKGLA